MAPHINISERPALGSLISNTVGMEQLGASAVASASSNMAPSSTAPSVGKTAGMISFQLKQPGLTRCSGGCGFQMPLHYPRYTRADYEQMPEWRLDLLLAEYGLPSHGDVSDKRGSAIAAFLWPSQC